MSTVDLLREHRKALDVHQKMLAFEMDSLQKANIERKMGDIFLEMGKIEGKRESFDNAIRMYNAALESNISKEYSSQTAKAFKGLGFAYAALLELDEFPKNIELEITAFEEALKFYTLEGFPLDFAAINSELGAAYRRQADLDKGDLVKRAESSRNAIEAWTNALKIYTPKDYPVEYTVAKIGLGNACLNLDEIDHDIELCRQAANAYEKALNFCTLEHSPVQFAAVKNNLAIAYISLCEAQFNPENCKRAIAACEDALKVRNPKEHALSYAAIMNNMGNAYLLLAKAENDREFCERALQAYRAAMQIYSLKQSSAQYAAIQNNLGNVYLILAEGENRAENCMKAVLAAQEALKIYTPDNSPLDFAAAQVRLLPKGSGHHLRHAGGD